MGFPSAQMELPSVSSRSLQKLLLKQDSFTVFHFQMLSLFECYLPDSMPASAVKTDGIVQYEKGQHRRGSELSFGKALLGHF